MAMKNTQALLVLAMVTVVSVAVTARGGWTSAELEELRSIPLTELEPPPPDPTKLKAVDLRQLEAFLRTLRGPVLVNLHPRPRPTQ
jgi:hypothetical protein